MDSEIFDRVTGLVLHCGCLTEKDRVLVLSDNLTGEIGNLIEEVSSKVTSKIKHKILPPLKKHGEEPPDEIRDLMEHSDLIFCLTSYSLAHSAARKKAAENGARFLSLPDYSFEVLSSRALGADFKSKKNICQQLADILTGGNTVKISTPLGTDLSFDIRGRFGNSAPGICDAPGSMASPPDIEVNIAPVEDGTNGLAVIDGSIPTPEIGILTAPVTLSLEKGRIKKIEGDKQAAVLKKILEKEKDEKVYLAGELGIGLNPLARLSGRMLEDEGIMGSAHLGFGSNFTIGGKNKVAFHLDMVLTKVTISVDNRMIMENGELCL